MALKLWRRGGLIAFVLSAHLSMAAPPALAQAGRSESDSERQQQAKVLESLGGAYEGPQAAYVTRIGETVAAAGGAAPCVHSSTSSMRTTRGRTSLGMLHFHGGVPARQ
mgnify:CR=1 FL=1